MSTDFVDAAYRHWEDAELLTEGERFATADHLYGICSECALKAILIEAGTAALTLKNGDLDRPFRIHLPQVWDECTRFSLGFPVRYAMALGQNPFGAWSVDQRYWDRAALASDPARWETHRTAARRTLAALEAARLDGRL